MTLGKPDFIRFPCPAAKRITPISFMVPTSKRLTGDYSESVDSIKVKVYLRRFSHKYSKRTLTLD
jgi:hypothetical protein